MDIEDVRPVPWGLARLLLAWGSLVSCLACELLFLLWVATKIPLARPSFVDLFAMFGVAAVTGSVFAGELVLMRALMGRQRPGAFYRSVIDRNWEGYRAHISPREKDSVVWDPIRGFEELQKPPFGDFSISAWLSGKNNLRQALIYDWRRGGGDVVRGLFARTEPVADIHRRTVDEQMVVLTDSEGTRITVTLADALHWCIPQAMTQEPPSLSIGLRRLRYAFLRMEGALDRARASLAEMTAKRDRSVSVCDDMERAMRAEGVKFAEQHSLVSAAIRYLWSAVWDVYNTRRLDGVRSSDGKTLRERLTARLIGLSTMPGAGRHDFQLERLPKTRRVRPQGKSVAQA